MYYEIYVVFNSTIWYKKIIHTRLLTYLIEKNKNELFYNYVNKTDIHTYIKHVWSRIKTKYFPRLNDDAYFGDSLTGRFPRDKSRYFRQARTIQYKNDSRILIIRTSVRVAFEYAAEKNARPTRVLCERLRNCLRIVGRNRDGRDLKAVRYVFWPRYILRSVWYLAPGKRPFACFLLLWPFNASL